MKLKTFETVLVQIVERRTMKELLPCEEIKVERKEIESDLYLCGRVKRAYLVSIENRLKYEPRLRESLAGVDWCIDACVI